MTAALNRKFDLLQKSGTCPSYLLDVLTLLVAHANETELFKQELRSAPFESAAPPTFADRGVAAAIPPQQQLATHNATNPVGLSAEAGDVLAAEKALHEYAENLRMINDIAMATSSKKLRAMKTSASTEMEAFRDRVLRDTVEQTREELDSLRMGWLESMNTEVERAKAGVHQVALSSQQALYKMVEGYSDYVSTGFQLLTTEPLEVTHRAMAECELCVERIKMLERQAMPRIEVDALHERLKSVERAIAQMGSIGSSARAVEDGTSAPPMVRPSRSESCTGAAEFVRPLGLRLRDGGDELEGLVVVEVAPNSTAAKAQIRPGHIVTHVGATLVTRQSDFTAAIQGAGAVVKLTVYDPETAGMRVVTL
ncbi:uncharacterized protein Tco025E_04920 [Trypanosoma conorhini]|uniref:PDZ domain-containing protein n=1 Tax=Trypanosoma conorhini TaxID=83891 RepID=A0A422PHJ9_9TRYP|nr:uncharacterized protein Tco025E_04920 [Trypanosoma conorhini]RNF17181.1 hypothetical protein Tco025E_04920 [Trypanosoma conorhini]